VKYVNIKLAILDSATEFQLTRDGMKPNNWWDNECKRANQEKHEVRRICLIKITRATLDNYRQKRTKANRTSRSKKKEWLVK
jgi:hypothetical protein